MKYFILILFSVFSFLGCNSQEQMDPNYQLLKVPETLDFLEKVDPLILDVRTEGEFLSGYIPGATLIPVQELPSRWEELLPYQNRGVFVYCRQSSGGSTPGKGFCPHW